MSGCWNRRRVALWTVSVVLVIACAVGALAWRTRAGLQPIPAALPPTAGEVQTVQLVDRSGEPLTVTYQNRWNVHDVVAYHDLPPLLREAFVAAEDKRFFDHDGVDWLARGHAFVQNVRARRPVRGASTISEQAVRILYPRPRTLWSRWLEGIEVRRLEQSSSKTEILEFYLNQVPYARQRRGVAQAARTYFDRDLDTLSVREMLALAVLVRSPSRLDLHRGTEAIAGPLERLADRMLASGSLTAAEHDAARTEALRVAEPRLAVDAAHFVRFVRTELEETETSRRSGSQGSRRHTTLSASLQGRVQQIVDERVTALSGRGVADGAVLVVDHTTDEILAWVNAGGFGDRPGAQIDKVTSPRQPGSTLKPFVYALALERGWTPATLIDDAPLADAVGHGRHSYRNYSRQFHGPIRLRHALGNSLNTPAVRAVRHAGREELLGRLRLAGLDTLTEHPDFYGDGLGLGTGEVSLYALVRAYAAFARGGELRRLRWSLDAADGARQPVRLFDAEVASLIADILSDPEARSLEFGRDSLLNLPIQTAVKTGTSNDYRDAWTVGFSHRYTVGVWMGNVDRRAMKEITGSMGPALVLRSVFAELHRHGESRPLFLSRGLVRRPICRLTGKVPAAACPVVDEWFRPERAPSALCPVHGDEAAPRAGSPTVAVASQWGGGVGGGVPGRPRLVSPSPGLHLAMDPRIPDTLESFEFRLAQAEGSSRIARVEWWVDDRLVASTAGASYLWPVARGPHVARARVWRFSVAQPVDTERVAFLVK